jgi:hypothetical protein
MTRARSVGEAARVEDERAHGNALPDVDASPASALEENVVEESALDAEPVPGPEPAGGRVLAGAKAHCAERARVLLHGVEDAEVRKGGDARGQEAFATGLGPRETAPLEECDDVARLGQVAGGG